MIQQGAPSGEPVAMSSAHPWLWKWLDLLERAIPLLEIAVSAIHLQSKNQVSNFGEAVVTIFPALVTG